MKSRTLTVAVVALAGIASGAVLVKSVGNGATGWRAGFFRRSRTQASPAAHALPAAAEKSVSGKPEE